MDMLLGYVVRRIRSPWGPVLLFMIVSRSAHLQAAEAARSLPSWPDSSQIFFENAFSEVQLPIGEGSGSRPAAGLMIPPQSGSGWSQLVTAEALESEVIAVVNKLRGVRRSTGIVLVTDETIHALRYLESLMFVVAEYDGDIRWQRDARLVQAGVHQILTDMPGPTDTDRFTDADKDPSRPGFSIEPFLRLVRGERWPSPPEQSPLGPIDPSPHRHRSNLMQRLEVSQNRISAVRPSSDSADPAAEEIEHEASIVRLVARLLESRDADDSSDPDYVAYCRAMGQASTKIVETLRAGNIAGIPGEAKGLRQSCDDCHSRYRD